MVCCKLEVAGWNPTWDNLFFISEKLLILPIVDRCIFHQVQYKIVRQGPFISILVSMLIQWKKAKLLSFGCHQFGNTITFQGRTSSTGHPKKLMEGKRGRRRREMKWQFSFCSEIHREFKSITCLQCLSPLFYNTVDQKNCVEQKKSPISKSFWSLSKNLALLG